MILRHIARQQGRALLRANAPTRACRRFYASEVDSTRPGQSSLDQSQLEKQALEALVQASKPPSVSQGQGSEVDADVINAVHKHHMLKHQARKMGHYGAVVPNHYTPSDLINNPPAPHNVTPELLLASQTHLGHATALWNPMNSRYIYGVRDGIHIIALEETLAHLRRVCRVVEAITERGGFVLFVGTRKGQEAAVVRAAQLAGGYHIFERWTPGLVSNANQVLDSARKKLVDMHDNEIHVSQENLEKMPAIKPDLVVCLNPLENWVLLNECAQEGVPTAAIIDTDADPTCVTYPIPANDDSLRAVALIAGALGRAGQSGQRKRLAAAAEGRMTYERAQLPQDFAETHVYMSKFDETNVPVEHVNADGSLMSQEQIEKMYRQGVIVDESLMRVYNDGDGGDLSATEFHKITEDGLVRVITPQGGVEPGQDSEIEAGDGSEPGSALPPLTEMDGVTSTDNPTAALDAALARFESIKQTSSDLGDEHAAFRLGQIEQEITMLRGEFLNLSSTPEERLEQAEDALVGLEAGLDARAVDEDAPLVSDQKTIDDVDEQLEVMDEDERIEAAKPKPDDKRQAKLDEEKRKKSH